MQSNSTSSFSFDFNFPIYPSIFGELTLPQLLNWSLTILNIYLIGTRFVNYLELRERNQVFLEQQEHKTILLEQKEPEEISFQEERTQEYMNCYIHTLNDYLKKVKKPKNVKKKEFDKIKQQIISQILDDIKETTQEKIKQKSIKLIRSFFQGYLELDELIEDYKKEIQMDISKQTNNFEIYQIKFRQKLVEESEKKLTTKIEKLKKSSTNKPAKKLVTSEPSKNDSFKEFEKIYNRNVTDAEALFATYFQLYDELTKTIFSKQESKNITNESKQENLINLEKQIKKKFLAKYDFISNQSNQEHPVNLKKNVAQINKSPSQENLQQLMDIIMLVKTKIEKIEELQKKILIEKIKLEAIEEEKTSLASEKTRKLKLKAPKEEATSLSPAEARKLKEFKEEMTSLPPEKTRKLERDLKHYERQMTTLTENKENQKNVEKETKKNSVYPFKSSLFTTADNKKIQEKEKKKNSVYHEDSDYNKSTSTDIYERVQKVITLFNNFLPTLRQLDLENISDKEKKVITTFLKCLLQDLAYNLSLGKRSIQSKFRNNAKYSLDNILNQDKNSIYTLSKALKEYIGLIHLNSTKKIAYCNRNITPDSPLLKTLLIINSEIIRSPTLKFIEQDEQGTKEEKLVELISSEIIKDSKLLDETAKTFTADHIKCQRRDHANKSGNYKGKNSEVLKLSSQDNEELENHFHLKQKVGLT